MTDVSDITIETADGVPVAATVFRPARPKAWCSIASATGVRRRYYRRFATAMAEHGIACVTFDYRGIGDTPAESAGSGPPTMRAWGEQHLDAVIAWIAEQEAKHQFHVGHSAGGQLLGLAAHNQHVEAAVAVASQAGYWKHWDRHRALMWSLWHVLLPGSTRLRGHFPAAWFGMGEPLPKTVALEWARWCRHPDFIVDADGVPLRRHFVSWTGRYRAYAIGDDQKFAPRRAAEALMGFYANAATEVVELDPADFDGEIGHFGYFQKCQEHWPVLAAWLLETKD